MSGIESERKQSIPWWLILIAIIAALLVLVIIAVVLWKVSSDVAALVLLFVHCVSLCLFSAAPFVCSVRLLLFVQCGFFKRRRMDDFKQHKGKIQKKKHNEDDDYYK